VAGGVGFEQVELEHVRPKAEAWIVGACQVTA
jgi:hypothetical protein